MSKKKKNNKDIDKYVKWMNIISIVLIFGLNILVFLIEFFDIFPIFDKFPSILFVLLITTLMGILILVWVRMNRPKEKPSEIIVNILKIIGLLIFACLIWFLTVFSPGVTLLIGIVIYVYVIVNKPEDTKKTKDTHSKKRSYATKSLLKGCSEALIMYSIVVIIIYYFLFMIISSLLDSCS